VHDEERIFDRDWKHLLPTGSPLVLRKWLSRANLQHKRLAIFRSFSIMHKIKIIKKNPPKGFGGSGLTFQELIRVENLQTTFSLDSYDINVVDNVSFAIGKGEIFGLVGESGSGKTMTALSILRLVTAPGRVTKGRVIFEGQDLLKMSATRMEAIRGGRIGMIFQEPMTALNPVIRVGDQLTEVLSVHLGLTRSAQKEMVFELLKRIGFDNPRQSFLKYPHQLSGGQRQRILIAISMACQPSLIIADEPTTALDVATEGQILCLLQDLVSQRRMSMLFITHNLHLIRSLGARIGIMYAGRLLELNKVSDFFHEPLHPYSKGLLDSIVGLKGDEQELRAIPGSVPRLSELPKGCTFSPRCPSATSRCKETEPQMIQVGEYKWVRCYLFQD
jgi:oligopeptide/dipeptide ABC transporter ATP-binding protein